jgi:hypothetical protein
MARRERIVPHERRAGSGDGPWKNLPPSKCGIRTTGQMSFTRAQASGMAISESFPMACPPMPQPSRRFH